jgi:hypothetical protein
MLIRLPSDCLVAAVYNNTVSGILSIRRRAHFDNKQTICVENRTSQTANGMPRTGPVTQPVFLCPAAGTGGDLLPGLFVYFVDILGQRVSLAAIHAAQTHRASTEQQQHFPVARLAFQSKLHMPVILADFIYFWKGCAVSGSQLPGSYNNIHGIPDLSVMPRFLVGHPSLNWIPAFAEMTSQYRYQFLMAGAGPSGRTDLL